MEPPSLDSTYGAWLIALVLEIFLFGTGVLQTWIYFAGRPADRFSIKFMVLVVLALESIQVVFFILSSYIRFIKCFGQIQTDFICCSCLLPNQKPRKIQSLGIRDIHNSRFGCHSNLEFIVAVLGSRNLPRFSCRLIRLLFVISLSEPFEKAKLAFTPCSGFPWYAAAHTIAAQTNFDWPSKNGCNRTSTPFTFAKGTNMPPQKFRDTPSHPKTAATEHPPPPLLPRLNLCLHKNLGTLLAQANFDGLSKNTSVSWTNRVHFELVAGQKQ
ncbi:hypothetical protein B0H17DRAFT_1148490 [Mycena rosella]|uniref:Uncharacterized protein n=1 Tax=Mycena rosella TaxID=1033263 RepID=A0AAD7FVN0_MYCRO|nr:hypothetical protein B0H17DRAFT_1148490 [Mycena rosella]